MSTPGSVDPSRTFGFEVLWQDTERALYRGWRENAAGVHTPVLAARPASNLQWTHSLGRLAHEYALKDTSTRHGRRDRWSSYQSAARST
jgi:hypothetical protein